VRIKFIALAALVLGTAVGLGAPKPVMAETPAQMEANKKLVLDFWHTVFDGQDVSKAKLYLAPGYRQHNPNVATGLKGFEDFFSVMFPKPKAAADIKLTQFDVVMAEGDLVQVMFKRPRPEVDDASKTYMSFWFDLFRVKDGKIVEHWDCALKPMQ
jgi:predicted SnoaL-like aldol condensation-catalyzing enzyme